MIPGPKYATSVDVILGPPLAHVLRRLVTSGWSGDAPLLLMLLLSLLIAARRPGHGRGDGPAPGAVARGSTVSSAGFPVRAAARRVSVSAGELERAAGRQRLVFVRRDLLTLDRGDFSSQGIAGDVNFAVTPRFDIVGSAEWAGHRAVRISRPRRQQPAAHSADDATPGGVDHRRCALRALPRGRAVSSLAWVPSRLARTSAAVLGFLWYNLVQYGDFVDFGLFRLRRPVAVRWMDAHGLRQWRDRHAAVETSLRHGRCDDINGPHLSSTTMCGPVSIRWISAASGCRRASVSHSDRPWTPSIRARIMT